MLVAKVVGKVIDVGTDKLIWIGFVHELRLLQHLGIDVGILANEEF